MNNNQDKIQSDKKLSFLFSSGSIYGISAISAATTDYIIDVSVKKMMITPPISEIKGLIRTSYSLMITRGFKVFQGLGIKVEIDVILLSYLFLLFAC